jgi:hypothetical protein
MPKPRVGRFTAFVLQGFAVVKSAWITSITATLGHDGSHLAELRPSKGREAGGIARGASGFNVDLLDARSCPSE